MNSTSYETTRAELFKRAKALFEFDANGVLPCMAPGMSGPIALPVGYLDISSLKFNGKLFGEALVLNWAETESAKIILSHVPRDKGLPQTRVASNEELRFVVEHYERAVCEYRTMVLSRCVAPGEEVPLWMKKRLGMAPYFDAKCAAAQ